MEVEKRLVSESDTQANVQAQFKEMDLIYMLRLLPVEKRSPYHIPYSHAA